MILFDEHPRKRRVPSPDEADAVALTFSQMAQRSCGTKTFIVH
jgi:hypothetical protein